MTEKLFGGLRGVFLVCGGLALASLILLNGTVLALVVLVLCAYACSRLRLPRFTLILFAAAFALRVAAVLLLSTPIISDFRTIWMAAHELNVGDMRYTSDTYFLAWAYQCSWIAWEALLIRIWDNPLFLQLVNCLLSAGTVCLLYRTMRGMVSQTAARMVGVLAAFFPFSFLLPVLLTNQIFSAFFLVLAVYLLVSKDCARLCFWRWPLAGLSLQLGNIMRAEGIVVLVAILAWVVFSALERPKEVKRLLCGLLSLLVVYFSVSAGASAAFKASGLSPNGLKNGDPLWKVVVGLNRETSGTYSAEDNAMVQRVMIDGKLSEETLEREKQLISERLNVPLRSLLGLVRDKIQMQWGKDALYFIVGPFSDYPEFKLYQTKTVDIVRGFDRGWFAAAVVLAFLGLFRRKKSDEFLPYFVFFAAFCAFVIIEVQARYAYMPQLFLFAAAAFGIDRIGEERKHG